MVRNRKKFTAGKIVILFIAGMFLMLLLIAGITTLIDMGKEVREVDLVTWYGFAKTSAKISSPNETALSYYDNIEVSIREFYRQEPAFDDGTPPIPKMNDEIIRFESDDCILAIFVVEVRNKMLCLQNFLFRKNEEKVSYPLYICNQYIKGYRVSVGIFHEEDRVARDIVQSYANDFTARINNGNILYYGAGLDTKLKNLTILGYTPTEVIPFEYNKQTYYFWYYLYDVPFTDLLEKKEVLRADMNEDSLLGAIGGFRFNTGEIIECLEITFSDD